MDKRILLFIGIIVIIALGIVAYKMFIGPTPVHVLTISIPNKNLIKGDPLTYGVVQQNKLKAERIKWDFGDVTMPSYLITGSHVYSREGTYLVKLYVDGKVSDSATVTVKPFNPLPGPEVIIAAQSVARVGEKVTFTDNTPGATQTHWKFGESGIEDGTGKTVSHTYKLPRRYTVIATNDVTIKQGIHAILIEPKPDSPNIHVKCPNINDDDFMKGMQDLVDHTDKFPQIYSALKLYLWGNDAVPVTVNGIKTTDFNSYCNSIIIQSSKLVSLKTTRDGACITAISVTQQ